MHAESSADLVAKGVAALRLGDEAAMLEAKSYYEKALKADPKNYTAAWRLAEVCYYLWEKYSGWESGLASKQEKLLSIAKLGAQAGQLAIKLNPDGVEGLFWYSAVLGVWGLTNGPLDSLTQVPVILQVTKRCIELDPQGDFERGGCYRVAGAVYTQVPGFPISIGDKKKAEELFQKSFIRGREYGINHNLYAELLIAKGDFEGAERVLNANLAMLRKRKPYDYFDRRDIKRAEDLLRVIEAKKRVD